MVMDEGRDEDSAENPAVDVGDGHATSRLTSQSSWRRIKFVLLLGLFTENVGVIFARMN